MSKGIGQVLTGYRIADCPQCRKPGAVILTGAVVDGLVASCGTCGHLLWACRLRPVRMTQIFGRLSVIGIHRLHLGYMLTIIDYVVYNRGRMNPT